MTPRVVGLDLSLTSTGVASADGSMTTLSFPKLSGMARLDAFHTWIMGAFVFCGVDDEGTPLNPVDLVVIEGYAMGTARQSHSYALGELGGVVRLAFWDAGVPFVDVAPASLKKFATGKGNANKDAVLIAAVKAGADVDGNDQADAYFLRQMGLIALGVEETKLAYRAEAVAKIEWPTAAEVVA